jgi:sugar phosphate isomerase/epimerase
MRLVQLPGDVHLTYCTNIHAGESWPDVRASLQAHVPAIKAAIAPDRPFGLGLRLSGQAAEAARAPEAIEAFRDQLAALGAYVFTINAFPYGPFHGVRVKEQVYLPDWRTPERVRYSADSAAVLSALLPSGVDGSISTVPGAFKENGKRPDERGAMAVNMMRTVAGLVQIERSTGKRIALALEPEPCCALETVDESIAFFEGELLSAASLDALATMIGSDRRQSETALRRHLGICYDVCHGAVEYEDPVGALDRLLGAGIALPKIQLSAAMRIPAMTADLIDAVMQFDEGTYLHQTVVNGKAGLTRYVDLADAVAAFRRGEANGEWRIHCHVPIFLRDLGKLGSTRDILVSTLKDLRRRHRSSHLEVETYTWDVLPQDLRTGSKADDIARELSFCVKEFVG